MQWLPSLTLLSTCAILGMTACAGSTVASSSADEGHVSIEQRVDDDLMTAGNTVDIEAQIQGDLAAAGANVTITAPVDGYVMAAGRHVQISSPVENDAWAAGETVNVSNHIGDNAMIAGRDVNLVRGAVVGHSASLAGNSVRSEARIEQDLRIAAATAAIGGNVGGDVEATASRVSVLPGAVIEGDLVVRSPNPPQISSDARINGSVRHEQTGGGGWGGWVWFWLAIFASLLVLGLASLVFAPRWAVRIGNTLKDRFGTSLLTGLALLVLVPVAVALLAFTIIGIPLAIVLLALFVALVLASGAFVSYELGTWISERRQAAWSPWLRILIGAAIVSIVISLPAVGWLAALLVVMLGTGAVVLERNAIGI